MSVEAVEEGIPHGPAALTGLSCWCGRRERGCGWGGGGCGGGCGDAGEPDHRSGLCSGAAVLQFKVFQVKVEQLDVWGQILEVLYKRI